MVAQSRWTKKGTTLRDLLTNYNTYKQNAENLKAEFINSEIPGDAFIKSEGQVDSLFFKYFSDIAIVKAYLAAVDDSSQNVEGQQSIIEDWISKELKIDNTRKSGNPERRKSNVSVVERLKCLSACCPGKFFGNTNSSSPV